MASKFLAAHYNMVGGVMEKLTPAGSYVNLCSRTTWILLSNLEFDPVVSCSIVAVARAHAHTFPF